jgi:hypothetical protein
MSLVVCSNNSNDIGDFDRGALDQAPFRFRNHLVNPLELPSNCEVAVQSVKINKNGLIRVSPTDKFYIYFGKQILSSTDPDSESTASCPIMGRILPSGSTEPIYVNMVRFTELLRDAVLLAIPHPDLDRTNTKVTAVYDGGSVGSQFSGFQFELKYLNGVGNGKDASGVGFASATDWKVLNNQFNPGATPSMDISLVSESGVVTETHLDNAGSEYTTGSYTNVATTTSGGGSGATLDLVIDGSGTITSVTINQGGVGYAFEDELVPLTATIGEGIDLVIVVEEVGAGSSKMKIQAVNDAGLNGNNVCWLNKRPLSHMGGLFTVDLTGLKESGTEKLNGGWAVGLVRGSELKTGQINTFDGRGGDLTNSRIFYDYVIYSEQIAGRGDFFLRVGHMVYNTDDATRRAGRPFVLNEIIYYDDGDGSSFASNTPWKAGDLVASGTNGYNLSRNVGKIDSLAFRINNEKIHIFVQSVNGTGLTGGWNNDRKTLVSFDHVSGHMKNKNIPKPVGTTCWNLYPKIMIRKAGRSVTVDKYDGREVLVNGVEAEATNPDASWFVRMQGDEASGRLAMAFDSRSIYRLGDNPTAVPTYTPLGTTDPFLSTATFDSYRFILLLGSGEPFYRYTGSANLQSRLGFQGEGIVGHNAGASDSQTNTHTSPDTPDLMDYSSAFVRLDNFTQKSYNAGTGRPSKILYQVPRFDTSNREFGNALYYEPQERTYIKLHNSEQIKLNELHLSICDNLERLCDAGITGKTVVCLHFRQSSTPLFKSVN